jgi:hypothetical protein
MRKSLRWAKLEGFSNYKIFENASIYMIKLDRFMRIHPDYKDGYMKAKLTSDEGKRVHFFINRLMWIAFHGPIPEKTEVDHVDGDRTNNHIENLSLVTHKQNQVLKRQRDSKFLWNTRRKRKRKNDDDQGKLL